MAYFARADLHDEQSHKLLRVAAQDGPASPCLRPGATNVLSRSRMLVLSTLDAAQRPSIAVWGGDYGFTQGLEESNIVIRATVDRNDQVAEELLGSEAVGEAVLDGRPTKVVSMLGIDLEAYTRVKLYGRLVSGARAEPRKGISEVLLVVSVERSFITRPGSFSPRHMLPNILSPRLISHSLPFIPDVVDVLARATVFFVSSSSHDFYLDIDQRSGPPGYVHLEANDKAKCALTYPEYSGIRLYQTLDGGGKVPTAALIFPDFSTGNLVFITGKKGILTREDAIRVLPRSNIAVMIDVETVRYVENGLPFCTLPRFWPSNLNENSSVEQVLHDEAPKKQTCARLVEKQLLTPTIARFGFLITDDEKTSRWRPGQYVTLEFERLLKPRLSSNARVSADIYDRKFTISSKAAERTRYRRFEITIRKVGVATSYLFSQDGQNACEIPLRGFGGEFTFHQEVQETIGLIAGGVGITPLLAQTDRLYLSRVRVYWAVRAVDLGLVIDSFERAPDLCGCTQLFVTGEINAEGTQHLTQLSRMKARVEMRRMEYDDLQLNTNGPGDWIRKWYLCTGAGLRKTLLEWLYDRNVIFETFNF